MAVASSRVNACDRPDRWQALKDEFEDNVLQLPVLQLWQMLAEIPRT